MTKRIIDILAIYFANKPVSKVYEYGSKSKGKGPAASDIDLLLELDQTRPVRIKISRMKSDLEKLLNVNIDLITNDSVSTYLRSYIEQDKLLVYKKDL